MEESALETLRRLSEEKSQTALEVEEALSQNNMKLTAIYVGMFFVYLGGFLLLFYLI